MKKCYTCQQEKVSTEFNKNKGQKDGLNSICKDCSRQRSRVYYQDNTALHKRNVYKNSVAYKAQLRNWVNTEVRKNGCCLCDEKEVCCLEFHHVNRKKKEGLVSYLISTNSKAKLEKELNKCAIVCSNCHRKIHAGLLPNPTDHRLTNVRVPSGKL